jgi:hypothetical protein
MEEEQLEVFGARVQLKNIDVTIPPIAGGDTGLSGGGSRHWRSIRFMQRKRRHGKFFGVCAAVSWRHGRLMWIRLRVEPGDFD